MTAIPSLFRPSRLGLAAAAALMSLALAGCKQDSSKADPQAVSVGTELDDSVITTKVKSVLLTDSVAKGADTSVETRKGEVLLSGFVDNQAQADREVELAKAVEGKTSAGAVLDDSVVTVKVKTALMTDAQTKASNIAVTTNKGIVQLSGFVDSPDEQARATSVARNVEGVQSVVNDTSIKK